MGNIEIKDKIALLCDILILVGICSFFFWIPKIYSYNLFILILIALPFIIEIIKIDNRKGLKDDMFLEFRKNKLIMFYFLIFGLSFLFYSTYSNTQIGSLFEGSDYQEKYWVNLFQNTENAKNYRVIADITATLSCTEGEPIDYDPFGERGESSKCDRVYIINKAYFNNGGFITFESENDNADYSLKLNKKIFITDDNGKEWYVELTNIKADKK